MSELSNDDSVAFDSSDATVKNGFESYKSADFKELKKYFYAVIMHGEKDGAYGDKLMDPHQFAPILRKWHSDYGKGRAILLISCWVGWAFARPLARATQLPIVAGLSEISFGMEFKKNKSKSILVVLDADGIKLADQLQNRKTPSDIKFRPEWVFYHPTGQVETIPGGNRLNQNEAIQRAKKYVKV